MVTKNQVWSFLQIEFQTGRKCFSFPMLLPSSYVLSIMEQGAPSLTQPKRQASWFHCWYFLIGFPVFAQVDKNRRRRRRQCSRSYIVKNGGGEQKIEPEAKLLLPFFKAKMKHWTLTWRFVRATANAGRGKNGHMLLCSLNFVWMALETNLQPLYFSPCHCPSNLLPQFWATILTVDEY